MNTKITPSNFTWHRTIISRTNNQNFQYQYYSSNISIYGKANMHHINEREKKLCEYYNYYIF